MLANAVIVSAPDPPAVPAGYRADGFRVRLVFLGMGGAHRAAETLPTLAAALRYAADEGLARTELFAAAVPVGDPAGRGLLLCEYDVRRGTWTDWMPG